MCSSSLPPIANTQDWAKGSFLQGKDMPAAGPGVSAWQCLSLKGFGAGEGLPCRVLVASHCLGLDAATGVQREGGQPVRLPWLVRAGLWGPGMRLASSLGEHIVPGTRLPCVLPEEEASHQEALEG